MVNTVFQASFYTVSTWLYSGLIMGLLLIEHPDENPEPAGETEASQEAPGPPSEDTSAADQEAPEGTAEEATQEQEVDGEPKPEEEGADEEGEDGQTEGEKPASPGTPSQLDLIYTIS